MKKPPVFKSSILLTLNALTVFPVFASGFEPPISHEQYSVKLRPDFFSDCTEGELGDLPALSTINLDSNALVTGKGIEIRDGVLRLGTVRANQWSSWTHNPLFYRLEKISTDSCGVVTYGGIGRRTGVGYSSFVYSIPLTNVTFKDARNSNCGHDFDIAINETSYKIDELFTIGDETVDNYAFPVGRLVESDMVCSETSAPDLGQIQFVKSGSPGGGAGTVISATATAKIENNSISIDGRKSTPLYLAETNYCGGKIFEAVGELVQIEDNTGVDRTIPGCEKYHTYGDYGVSYSHFGSVYLNAAPSK